VASVTRRVFGALNRLYAFAGGRTAPDSVELTSPVQLVHDVSREVELDAGFVFTNGYWTYQYSWEEGVSSDRVPRNIYYDFVNRTDINIGQELTEDDISVWLIDMIVRSQDSASLQYFNVSVNYDDGSHGIVHHQYQIIQPVFEWVTGGATGDYSRFDYQQDLTVLHNGLTRVPFPMPLFNGARLISTAQGAGDEVCFTALLWAGMKGTTPPGMR